MARQPNTTKQANTASRPAKALAGLPVSMSSLRSKIMETSNSAEFRLARIQYKIEQKAKRLLAARIESTRKCRSAMSRPLADVAPKGGQR